MSHLGLRLRIIGVLPMPFAAVWVTSAVRVTGSLVSPAWFAWINAAFIVVALYVLAAPFFLQRPLRNKPVRIPGGTDGLLLLMGVGGAAAASIIPVVLFVVGSGSVAWVLPCAALCFLVQMFWCWRLRGVLLQRTPPAP